MKTSPFPPAGYFRAMALPLAGLAVAIFVSGCNSLDHVSHKVANAMSPYQIDIVQGNVVTREQFAALRKGMRRNTVRNILGTPLLESAFHADRWDYVFTFRRQGMETQSRRATVYFEGDVLARFEADPLPSEAEFVASLDHHRPTGPIPVLESPPIPTQAAPTAPVSAVLPPPAPEPLPTSYPPLEDDALAP
ncbi:outer membrane protein assembly factor BamE [Candidatus Symbiobacter mobilis]|uniref:Outer membrane protein assembly factor BamE n=1 Tax=Candidatus Symbiobacter mobilis CR TaxID=946483 RepID=U5NEI4_9BURK|nr:outer membrane protein assembly factor BamE [Candidatus Symbiobacter mobilis]AGX88559.1 tmRNA-binding small protein A [Candidatus Symbiobacter mobilis CR]